MKITNVKLVKIKDLPQEVKEKYNLESVEGLCALETHPPEYITKVVEIKKGLISYILEGE